MADILSMSNTLLTISTLLSLVAFAANSVLCRLALADGAIDATSFTLIRLLSGLAILAPLVALRRNNIQEPQNTHENKGRWTTTLALFIYAAGFSYAYITLDTGTGALILFTFVQLTMIVATLLSGSRLSKPEWLGLLLAFFGLVYLLLPGISSPPLLGALIMATAGIAWATYTLSGRYSTTPLDDTYYHFLRAFPIAIAVALIVLLLNPGSLSVTSRGVLLACASGAIASGLGYAIWYCALKGLSVTQAAALQLLVPIIAAMGGVMFANETLSYRLVLSSTIILGGVALVILSQKTKGTCD